MMKMNMSGVCMVSLSVIAILLSTLGSADITSNIDLNRTITIATADLSDNKSCWYSDNTYIGNLSFYGSDKGMVVNVTNKSSASRGFHIVGLKCLPSSTIKFKISTTDITADSQNMYLRIGSAMLLFKYYTSSHSQIQALYFNTTSGSSRTQVVETFANTWNFTVTIDFNEGSQTYNLTANSSNENHQWNNLLYYDYMRIINDTESSMCEPWVVEISIGNSHKNYSILIEYINQTIPQSVLSTSIGGISGIQIDGSDECAWKYARPIISKYNAKLTMLPAPAYTSVAQWNYLRDLHENYSWDIDLHTTHKLTELSLADAYAEIDLEIQNITDEIGEIPFCWTALGNGLNFSHVNYTWSVWNKSPTRATSTSSTFGAPYMYSIYQQNNVSYNLGALYDRAEITNIYTHRVMPNTSSPFAEGHDVLNATFDHYLRIAYTRGIRITTFQEMWKAARNQIATNYTSVSFSTDNYTFTPQTNGFVAYVIVDDYYNISNNGIAYVKDTDGYIKTWKNETEFEFWVNDSEEYIIRYMNITSEQNYSTDNGYWQENYINVSIPDQSILSVIDSLGRYQIYVNESKLILPYNDAKTITNITINNATSYNTSIPRLAEVSNPTTDITQATYNTTQIKINASCSSCTYNLTIQNIPWPYITIFRDNEMITNWTYNGSTTIINGWSSSENEYVIQAGVSSCQTLTNDTHISGNLISEGDCIIIGANDITLDCQGFSIMGNKSGIGINITGYNDTILTNCTVTNFSKQIFAYDVTNISFKDSKSLDAHFYNATGIHVDLDYTNCRYAFRGAKISEVDWDTCTFNLTLPQSRVVHVESYEAKGIPYQYILGWGALGLAVLIWLFRLRRGRRFSLEPVRRVFGGLNVRQVIFMCIVYVVIGGAAILYFVPGFDAEVIAPYKYLRVVGLLGSLVFVCDICGLFQSKKKETLGGIVIIGLLGMGYLPGGLIDTQTINSCELSFIMRSNTPYYYTPFGVYDAFARMTIYLDTGANNITITDDAHWNVSGDYSYGKRVESWTQADGFVENQTRLCFKLKEYTGYKDIELIYNLGIKCDGYDVNFGDWDSSNSIGIQDTDIRTNSRQDNWIILGLVNSPSSGDQAVYCTGIIREGPELWINQSGLTFNKTIYKINEGDDIQISVRVDNTGKLNEPGASVSLYLDDVLNETISDVYVTSGTSTTVTFNKTIHYISNKLKVETIVTPYDSDIEGMEFNNKAVKYIIRQRPYLFFNDSTQTAGYLNQGVSPYNSWISSLVSYAGTCYGYDYSSTSVAEATRATCCQRLAAYYLLNTSRTHYADKAIECIKNIGTSSSWSFADRTKEGDQIPNTYGCGGCSNEIYGLVTTDGNTYRDMMRYGIAYDWIHEYAEGAGKDADIVVMRDKLGELGATTYLINREITSYMDALAAFSGVSLSTFGDYGEGKIETESLLGLTALSVLDYDGQHQDLDGYPDEWIEFWEQDFLNDSQSGAFIPIAKQMQSDDGVYQEGGGYRNYYKDAEFYPYLAYTNTFGSIINEYDLAQGAMVYLPYMVTPNGGYPNYCVGYGKKHQSEYIALNAFEEGTSERIVINKYINEVLNTNLASGTSGMCDYEKIFLYNSSEPYYLDNASWISKDNQFLIMRNNWSRGALYLSLKTHNEPAMSGHQFGEADQNTFDMWAYGAYLVVDSSDERFLGQLRTCDSQEGHTMISVLTGGTYEPPYKNRKGQYGATNLVPIYIDYYALDNLLDFSESSGYMDHAGVGNTHDDIDTPFTWTRDILRVSGDYFIVTDRMNSSVSNTYRSNIPFCSADGHIGGTSDYDNYGYGNLTFTDSVSTYGVNWFNYVNPSSSSWFLGSGHSDVNRMVWDSVSDVDSVVTEAHEVNMSVYLNPSRYVTVEAAGVHYGGYGANSEWICPSMRLDTISGASAKQIYIYYPSNESNNPVYPTVTDLTVTGSSGGDDHATKIELGDSVDRVSVSNGESISFDTDCSTDAEFSFSRTNTLGLESMVITKGSKYNVDSADYILASQDLDYLYMRDIQDARLIYSQGINGTNVTLKLPCNSSTYVTRNNVNLTEGSEFACSNSSYIWILMDFDGITEFRVLQGAEGVETNITVTLIAPVNNAIMKESTPIFNMTVIGTGATYDCTLYLNDTNKCNLPTVTNDTLTSMASSYLSNGTYYWNVNCTYLLESAISETRTVTIGETTTTTTTIPIPEYKYSINTTGNSTFSAGTFTDTMIKWSNDVLQLNWVYDIYSYWSCDKGTGDVLIDQGGRANGTLVNMYPEGWGPGKYATGLDFDGSDDYVNLGAMNVEGDEMTLMAWFRSTNLANCPTHKDCRIISKTNSTSEQDHIWLLSTIDSSGNVRLRFRLKTSVGDTTTLIASSGNILDDELRHGTAVYNSTHMLLYLDGALVGSVGKTGDIAQGDALAWIGGNPPSSTSRPWAGMVDEVYVFNRSLNSSEINAIMENTHYSSGNYTSVEINVGTGYVCSNVTVSFTDSLINLFFGEYSLYEWINKGNSIVSGTNYGLNGTSQKCKIRLELETSNVTKTPTVSDINVWYVLGETTTTSTTVPTTTTTQPPNTVVLKSPADNYTWTSSNTVNFTYQHTVDLIHNCTLYIKNTTTINATTVEDRGKIAQLGINCDNVFSHKIGDYVYGICGAEDDTPTNYTFRYNIATKQSEPRVKKPFVTDREACAWTGSMFACAGGYTGSGYEKRTYRYNPTANTAISNAGEDLPIALFRSKACSNGTHVWVMGGLNSSAVYETNIYRWDLGAQTIVDTGNDMYDAGYSYATVIDLGPDDERCFIIGGKSYVTFEEVLLFNKTTETTSIYATMPLGLYCAVGFRVDDFVYYGGGLSTSYVWNYNWYKFNVSDYVPGGDTTVTLMDGGDTMYPRATSGAEWLSDSQRGLLLGGTYGPTGYPVTSNVTEIHLFDYLTNVSMSPAESTPHTYYRGLSNTTDYFWSISCSNTNNIIYDSPEWNISLSLRPYIPYTPFILIVKG